MAASSIGILIGASVGAAYLGGHLAHDSGNRREAGRLLQFASVSKDGKVDTSALARLQPITENHNIDFGAMAIALRLTPGNDDVGANSLMSQNITALRTFEDSRAQKAQIVRANLVTGAALGAGIVADHPVSPASAFAFKAHSQNDADCLTQGVYYEARGEGTDGMRAVAQVILNRVRHPLYPKTICGVVYQGAYLRTSCQFSFVCNGAMRAPVEAWAWRRAKSIADAALAGSVMASVGSATHFHTINVSPVWAGNMTQITQVGSHIFYQFRGRGSRIGSGDNVQPSDAVPETGSDTGVTADGVISPADTMGAEAIQIADATPALQPSTVSPTGEARTQLIKVFNDSQSQMAKAQSAKPVQAAAQLSGQPAKELVSALKPQTTLAANSNAQ